MDEASANESGTSEADNRLTLRVATWADAPNIDLFASEALSSPWFSFPGLGSALDDPLRQKVFVLKHADGVLAAVLYGVVRPAASIASSARHPFLQFTVLGAHAVGFETASDGVQELFDWAWLRGCRSVVWEVGDDDARCLELQRALGFDIGAPLVRSTRSLAAPAKDIAGVAASTPPSLDPVDIASGVELDSGREELPSPRWWLHGLVIAGGVTSILATDPWSGDVWRGGVFLALDSLFLIYLFGFAAWLRYRRQTSRSPPGF